MFDKRRSSKLIICLIVGLVPNMHAPGIDSFMFGSSSFRGIYTFRRTFISEKISTTYAQNYSIFPQMTWARYYCASANVRYSWQGRYVKVLKNGVVEISQPDILNSLLLQTCASNKISEPSYRIVSDMKIDKGNGMPYHEIEFDSPNLQNITNEKEAIIDRNQKFIGISKEMVNELPYSSCGMLDMVIDHHLYHGSAFAISNNILITVGHNFVPDKLDDLDNYARESASSTSFYYRRISGEECSKKVSGKFVVHPEWKKNFNREYDFAVMFLDTSLNIKPGESLQLKVESPYIGIINVVGYPLGNPQMKQSSGNGATWYDALS